MSEYIATHLTVLDYCTDIYGNHYPRVHRAVPCVSLTRREMQQLFHVGRVYSSLDTLF